MKNILICGAGRSATDAITYLLEHAEENDWFVTVGDISVETAEKKIGAHPRGRAVYFDCFDDEIMTKYIKEADIVISLLPPGMHAAAARIALEYNAHVVTASYASPEMLEMNEKAKKFISYIFVSRTCSLKILALKFHYNSPCIWEKSRTFKYFFINIIKPNTIQ